MSRLQSALASAVAPTTDLTHLMGEGRRVWARMRPTTRRPCRVTARGFGEGVELSQLPVDLSLGGCGLRWTTAPPPRGARCTVEVQLPLATVLVPAVVAHVRVVGGHSGLFGLRFQPGAALEAAMIPLAAYLMSLVPSAGADDDGTDRGGTP